MSIVSTLLFVAVWGVAIGAGGRWLVPGPDPMPAWLTMAIGIAGSLVGAGAIVAVVGLPETAGEAYAVIWATIAASLAASALLVVAYRRFVQHRAIVGRTAYHMPSKGIGIPAILERLGIEHRAQNASSPGREAAQRLSELAELRERGLITDEEFETKRAEVIAAI